MKAMRDVWGDKLVELGATDPRTVVLDGDLGNSTKVDKFAKAHPERFFQMGIAEQNLVGAAAGLASVGYVPWTSSFAVFFTHRAIDPIRMLVAQSHANVKIVGSYSGLLIGAVGKTHLDVQDLAIMRAMPDITVLSPADEAELISMMDWAQAYDGPVYLRIVRDAVDKLGRIDVLVNNAGVTSAKPALDLTSEDFDKIFTIDVRGAFLLARAAALSMKESGGGSILNITSVHEHIPRPGFALYAAGKAALGMLTRSLALELAARGGGVGAAALCGGGGQGDALIVRAGPREQP